MCVFVCFTWWYEMFVKKGDRKFIIRKKKHNTLFFVTNSIEGSFHLRNRGKNKSKRIENISKEK